MDDNSPTNTTTIARRQDQTDITQFTAKPATQDWTSHAARTRTEGGSGRAPSKHGRAAHARRGHEQDAETRPRTLARPGKSSTGTLYTHLSSLYTQKQHPHAAKQNTPAAQPRRRSTPKRRPNQRRPSETTERENQDDSHRSRAYLLL